jgi:hypothetical protein
MMRIAIYRSTTCRLYPEETLTYCYDFEPIRAAELTRDDLLLGWTKDSGSNPFAMIESPEGSRIARTQEGWLLFFPDNSVGIAADEVYELAVDQCLGLSVISESLTLRSAF